MDSNILIYWGIGAVMIAVGVPIFFLGRYLLASEDVKKPRAWQLRIIGIVWMSVGVILYIIAILKMKGVI